MTSWLQSKIKSLALSLDLSADLYIVDHSLILNCSNIGLRFLEIRHWIGFLPIYFCPCTHSAYMFKWQLFSNTFADVCRPSWFMHYLAFFCSHFIGLHVIRYITSESFTPVSFFWCYIERSSFDNCYRKSNTWMLLRRRFFRWRLTNSSFHWRRLGAEFGGDGKQISRTKISNDLF